MGQKVNPHGLRVGIVKDWDAKWYADKDFAANLHEDVKIRNFLKETLFIAGISRIEIERTNKRIKLTIHTAKPGMVIGRGGAGIEDIKKAMTRFTDKQVDVNIAEIKQADMDAVLVAENIAGQLERRIGFRRAMKQAVGRTMRLGAKGIKIMVSGRLGGAEIARSESYREGSIPLHTLVQTSTTVLLKLIQHMVVSALKYGFTKVKFCQKQNNLLRRKKVASNAYSKARKTS